MAKTRGYVLAAHAGKVQFQVLNPDGSVLLEITDWVDYDEAKELMTQSDN
jgi:hypothetical protein